MRLTTRFVPIVLLLSLAIPQTFAGPIPGGLQPEEASSSGQGDMWNGDNEALSMGLGEMVNANAITDVTDLLGYERECQNFSDTDALGRWGSVVATEIASGRYQQLHQGPQDLLRLCPKYTSMPENSKQELWVLIINAIAHFESSCRSGIVARGVNGPAAGLLQLFKGREQNFSAGCQRGDATNPPRAIKCGLSMLNDQVERDGFLFSDESYWAVMRPHNRVGKASKIMDAVSMFEPCRR